METVTPSQQKPIQFKPLHKGMGFHTPENGLPYEASSVITQKLTPSTPLPETRDFNVPRFAMPVRSTPSILEPMPKAAPQFSQAVEEEPVAEFDNLYVMKRIIAYCIDTAFNILVCGLSLSAVLFYLDTHPKIILENDLERPVLMFLFGFSWILVLAQEIAFGTSLGKRFFGMSLQGSPTLLLGRALLFLPSLALVGVGLLWAFFDPQKRCLHDVAMSSQPTEYAEL